MMAARATALAKPRRGRGTGKSEDQAMAAKQVIVYFENPADALRFTLAASSAITGEGRAPTSAARGDVGHEIRRATRIVAENVALSEPE